MASENEDFSPVQTERRAAAICSLLKNCLTEIDKVETSEIRLELRKQINHCLIEAYNAGFVDSQNETKDTFRIHE